MTFWKGVHKAFPEREPLLDSSRTLSKGRPHDEWGGIGGRREEFLEERQSLNFPGSYVNFPGSYGISPALTSPILRPSSVHSTAPS